MTDHHVPGRRHVVVVAAHCPQEGPLPELEPAARELHGVLVDPLLGACHERAGEPASLVMGADLTPARVQDAIVAAGRHAARDGGVLVVALLGHGFSSPHLHYMVGGSVRTDPTSALDVRSTLTAVANMQGLDGVIALIDTCDAAGGIPAVDSLIDGPRAGVTRVAVLSASTAHQRAWSLTFSTALARTAKEGLTATGSVIGVDETLVSHLNSRVDGQTIGSSVHNHDAYAADGLWLFRNARHALDAAAGTVGPLGRSQLAEGLQSLTGAPAPPSLWNRHELTLFKESVAACEATGMLERAARARLLRVTEGLLECARTHAFLNDNLHSLLSEERLRGVGRLLRYPPDLLAAPLLRDLLEHAVLRAQPEHAPPFQALAGLMAALAHLGDQDLTGPLLLWAQERGAVAEVRTSLDALAKADKAAGVRLVLGLDDPWGNWPVEIQGWLVRGGETVGSEVFECPSQDARGVGAAIARALSWARSQLSADERPLEFVDVAASGQLLACWHPEETLAGRRLLGVGQRVTMRWSGALYSNADDLDDPWAINDASQKVIHQVEACGDTSALRWVDNDDLENVEALHHKLATWTVDGALGVSRRPPDFAPALEALLPYAPILLWPREGTTLDDARLQHVVAKHWQALPGGLTDAYRRQLDPAACEAADELAEVRAVWHDHGWLAFCRQFEDREVTVPEETS
ncbi:vWA-MoxR associated conflict system protein [Kitasatospora sp. NPDC003701]